MGFEKKLRKTTEEPGENAEGAQSENIPGSEKDLPLPEESVKRSAIFRKLKNIGYKTGEIKTIFGKRKKSSARVREKKQEK
jgi:hypothetical protein